MMPAGVTKVKCILFIKLPILKLRIHFKFLYVGARALLEAFYLLMHFNIYGKHI